MAQTMDSEVVPHPHPKKKKKKKHRSRGSNGSARHLRFADRIGSFELGAPETAGAV